MSVVRSRKHSRADIEGFSFAKYALDDSQRSRMPELAPWKSGVRRAASLLPTHKPACGHRPLQKGIFMRHMKFCTVCSEAWKKGEIIHA